MTHNITEPLRLAVGSHEAGSGKGCAMNVVSWENGDDEITDRPGCVDRRIAGIVRGLNDHGCQHREGDLLCAPCSVAILDLAHRVMGTTGSAVTAEWWNENFRGLLEVIGNGPQDDGLRHGGFMVRPVPPWFDETPSEVRIAWVRSVVDRYLEVTGQQAGKTSPEVTAEAVQKMLVKA